MNTQTTITTPHFHALDGLRGVAAILVVLLHVEWRNHITGTCFVTNGYLAVDLFFILSGLVIATNYSTRIVDITTALRFVGLRFFRLYPLHIAMLGAFAGLEFCKLAVVQAAGIAPEHPPFSGGMSYRSLAANILLVNGLGWMRQAGWNGPSWSISCEFFAYLAFAISALLGLIRSRLFLICCAAIAVFAYGAIALSRGTLNATWDLGIVRCFSGFFLGVVIARWRRVSWLRSSEPMGHYEVPIASVLLLSMAIKSGPMVVFEIPLFVFFIACLRVERGPIARLLKSKPLQYIGRISYSIYMVHELVVVCLLMALKRIVRMSFDVNVGRAIAATNPWFGDVLTIALVAVVMFLASQTYRFIEEPGRKLGRRLLGNSVRGHSVSVLATKELVGRQVPSEV